MTNKEDDFEKNIYDKISSILKAHNTQINSISKTTAELKKYINSNVEQISSISNYICTFSNTYNKKYNEQLISFTKKCLSL